MSSQAKTLRAAQGFSAHPPGDQSNIRIVGAPQEVRPRRNPTRFNAVTSLSERQPFEDDNVIDYLPWRIGSFPWISSAGLSTSLRRLIAIPLGFSPRGEAKDYYDPRWRNLSNWSRQDRYSNVPRHHLTKDGAGDLGAVALSAISRYFDRDREKIEALRHGRNTTYLILRNVPVLPFFFRFPPDREFPEEQKHRESEYIERLIENRPFDEPEEFKQRSADQLRRKRNALNEKLKHADFVIAGLGRMLGCTIRPRKQDVTDHPIVRNLLTEPGEQQSSDLDNSDVALRFQQSTVEKELPSPNASEGAGAGDTCRFRIYLCIKNFLRLPVYVVSVAEVVRHIAPDDSKKRKRVIENLAKDKSYDRRPPTGGNKYGELWQDGGPVLRNLRSNTPIDPPDWVMSYDQERVRARAQNPGSEEALFELREAIRRARRDAIRIVLKPGDILLVDNMRAMISRREFFPVRFLDILRTTLSWANLRLVYHVKNTDGSIASYSYWPFPPLPFAGPYVRWVKAENEVVTEIRPPLWSRIAALFGSGKPHHWPFRPHRWLRSYYAFPAETAEHGG